jgi:ATP-dependent protease ClpP protease subunit
MNKKLRILSVLVGIGVAWLIGGCSGDPIISRSVVPLKLEITVVSGDPASVVVNEAKDIMGGSGLNSESGGELSNLSYISGGRLNTYLFSGMSVTDVVSIHKDISKVEDNTDIRTMRMFINSPGGSAFAGLAIADMINQARSRGWTVEANATGIVASAAVPVFAVCSPRYAAEGTLFMVHEAALWKWPGKETASDIRAQQKLMIVLQDQYLSYLVDNSNLSHDAWVEKERATTWFTADEALLWGLVDDIR